MSKYKLIDFKELKDSFRYVNLKEARTDGQIIASNYKFLALSWEGGSHTRIAILEKKKPIPIEKIPTIEAHPQNINDLRWSPFVKNLLASASDDGTIKLWKIPEDGLKEEIKIEDQKFIEHTKKVNLMKFHPTCAEIMGSCGFDNSIKVWNLEQGTSYSTLNTVENFGSLDWNYDGSIIGGCKFQTIRLFDPRTGKEIGQAKGSELNKPQKMLFVNKDNFLTIGFGKNGREAKLFDIKNLGSPINTLKIDDQNEVFYPYYDYDSGIIFLPGKNSKKMHLYNYMNGNISILHQNYQLTEPTQYFTLDEKRFVDYKSNEMTRMYFFNNHFLKMTSFFIPRKGLFDRDLYPDTFSGEPSLTADEWVSGTNKDPVLKPIENINPEGAIKSINMIKSQDPKKDLSINEKIQLLKEENQELKDKLTEKRNSNQELVNEIERLKALINK